MMNALFSSKASGTKSFNLDGVEFGWSAIEMLYERVQQGEGGKDSYGSKA